MAKIYACSMTHTVGFWLKANSEDEALEWLQTHTLEDVLALTRNTDDSWDEYLGDEYDEDEQDNWDYIDATEEA